MALWKFHHGIRNKLLNVSSYNLIMREFALFLFGIIIIVFIAYIYYLPSLSKAMPEAPEQPVDLPTEGYEPVQVTVVGTTLAFVGKCRVVNMDILESQALSIQQGLEQTIGVRPTTHDVFSDVTGHFSIRIPQVRIESYADDIYFATIVAVKGNKVLETDARPSDAVAMAVRTNATIYFKKTLLDSNGIVTC